MRCSAWLWMTFLAVFPMILSKLCETRRTCVLDRNFVTCNTL
ncbi:hypothetical protein NY08_4698 [Rhodococcus sp. B7740]|nr:hypothetical protein NY08_4698 [Rhodococcus sp. B7740]